MKFFKNKTNIIIVVIVAIVILAVLVSVIKPKEKIKDASASDYKLVTDVPGCEFEISKSISDNATAVTEISKNINFLNYETYSFKNGSDLFIIFNMKRYITIVKKGTHFNLSTDNIKDSLKANDLQGIWFTPIDKEKVQKNGNKYSVKVKAEVVITNELYNDFEGTLVTLEKDGEEWSMFTGYLNPEDKDSISMSNYIAKTFENAENYQVVQADFTIDVETDQVISINNEEIETPIQITEESIKEVSQTPKEDKKEEEASSSESLTASAKEREIVTDEKTAYSSSIYSMLPVNSIGYMDILNEDVGYLEPAYIKISKVYSEDETVTLINELKNMPGNEYISSIEIPDNCHLEAIMYDVRYTSQTESYIDIELASVDGDTFRHRGVKYNNDTYLAITETTSANDWKSGNIVLYVIPNGCYEYALQCTGIIKNDKNRPAWFKVCTKK